MVVFASVAPVVLPKLLRHGVAAGDEAFMKLLVKSIVIMESLAESILLMKKQREQLKMMKEDLSRKLKNARQRYTRLKKKALLASGDLVDDLSTGIGVWTASLPPLQLALGSAGVNHS